MTVDVGTEAPDFTLRDSEGENVRLVEYRGNKNVLLVFYPFTFSPGCSSEFCDLRDKNSDLVSDAETEVLAVSVDPVWSARAWKDQQKFPNRFLSDFWPHGEVSRVYGAFDDGLGFSHRHTFLIDKSGIVRFVERNSAKRLRNQDGWREAIHSLAADASLSAVGALDDHA
ncbi:MAG: redoxin domain-containing protein [Actinomycetota bacterium]